MGWVIRSVLALALLAFLVVAGLVLMPSERIAAMATDRFAALTGRQLVVQGAVRPSIWPVLGVQTGPVSVANADWSEQGPMLQAKGLSIALDMPALLRGEMRIASIKAQSPQLVLERAKDGRENWAFDREGGTADGGTADGGTGSQGTAPAARPFTLDLAEVEDGSVIFIDHREGQRVVLDWIKGEIRQPSFQGKADIRFAATMNGQPVEATLAIAEFAPFLDGKVVGVDLAIKSGDADVVFDGRAGWSPRAAEGNMRANLGDLSALARLAGAAKPDLPEGLGKRSVAATGRVTVTDKLSFHLRDGQITLDSHRLGVDADLTTAGERPKLSAQVSAGPLVLGDVVGGKGGEIGGGARGGTQAASWPTTPIDVSALAMLDASVALTADSVDLGLAKFGTTRIVTTIERARAVFDLREVAAYQGTISGQFVVNGRGGLSVGGDLVLAGLAMQPLLVDLGGYDRLIGTGDLRLKFLGVGNSVDEIMRSLSGSGSLSLGKGELRGLDIAGMLRTLDAGYVGEGQKTIFETVSASFAIDKGVLANDDLSMKAPYVTATGNGTVNLGARTLDYRLRPVALAAVDGSGGVLVPLMITGSWANPKFRLDLESIARERLETEAKALEERARAEAREAEARARAELERRAQEDLGIVRQEGESLEDAAKRRLREAADEEAVRLLERLLGGN
jgi:AsmA protein